MGRLRPRNAWRSSVPERYKGVPCFACAFVSNRPVPHPYVLFYQFTGAARSQSPKGRKIKPRCGEHADRYPRAFNEWLPLYFYGDCQGGQRPVRRTAPPVTPLTGALSTISLDEERNGVAGCERFAFTGHRTMPRTYQREASLQERKTISSIRRTSLPGSSRSPWQLRSMPARRPAGQPAGCRTCQR